MKDLSNENIIHVKNNGVEYIQFRKLLEYKDVIRHAFSLRDLNFGIHHDIPGNIEGIYKNNKILCDEIGLDYINIVKPRQAHTTNIRVIDGKICDDKPDMYLEDYFYVDGIITNKRDLILSTVNADCMLLLFFDTKNNAIANVHSGWKGTFNKIAPKTVEMMRKEYGTDSKDLICCVTPSIRQCHFEVDTDVRDLCEEIFAYTNRLDDIIKAGRVYEGKQKYNIDTVLINQLLLEETGMKPENIIDSKICSVCDSDYIHSRRASGADDFKHSTALISLK